MRVIGRDAETAWLTELIAGAPTRSLVVTIDAPAGTGKSAMMSLAGELALQAGARVLSCRPSAAEAHYAYAALGDVLSKVTDLDAVDPVPRRALQRALLRRADEPGDDPLDARAVGVACAALWQSLAQAGPLVVLIDDVHWLDGPSAEALAFTTRRLPPTGVVVVGARRTAEPGPTLPGDTHVLQPLAPAAITALLGDRAATGERHLTARESRAIVEAAGGNPLFALELARHAARRPATSDTRPAVPATLEALIADRFADLDAHVVEALAIAALLARPTIQAARELGITEAIERSERDGLVDTASGRIVFAHPLFAAVVSQRVPAAARRRLHQRIATAITDPEQQLRHAAFAAEVADGPLATRLAQQAMVLEARGAGEQAAELAEFAARLSPQDAPERHDRHVEAARLAFQRGEADLAQQLLSEVDGVAASPTSTVREMLVRAKVEFSLGSAERARRHALHALQHCTSDEERVEVHAMLARVSYDDFDESTRQATVAMELAERCELPDAVLADVLTARAGEAFMAGHGLDRQMFERAIALEQGSVQFSADSAYSSFAVLLKIADEFDESRTMLLSVLRHNDDEGAVPFVLSHLPQLELWTGNWDAAEEYAQQHLEAALRTGQHDQALQARSNLALIDVHRGDAAAAAVLAEEVRAAGVASGDAWTERSGLGLLGLVAMAEGDAERAVVLLQRWHELGERMALREPGYCRMQGELVEAMVATGRVDDAAACAAMMQANAVRLARPTLLAGAARAHALVAAAQGDRDAAVASATAAVEGFAATPMVVEHARALLTLGQIHRRFKEKAAARTALEAALEVFDRLGAERLAERTRQDLARIGLRTATATALTETELRVARLAATGRTVRQVGNELFISPKTVEANLTRVYRKLGLSGRAELATWAATVDTRD